MRKIFYLNKVENLHLKEAQLKAIKSFQHVENEIMAQFHLTVMVEWVFWGRIHQFILKDFLLKKKCEEKKRSE